MAIVASGPSAKTAGVGRLKGVLPVLAIKNNVELAPFAEAVYGCDFPWWEQVAGLPNFPGLKLAYDKRACDQFGCQRVQIPEPKGNRLLFGEIGVVGAGGNSGFQALNLAVQWGATKVLLVGFDMHARSGVHWYGRNTAFRASNPDEDNFRRWRAAFDAAASDLQARGVEAINASPISDLKAFRRLNLEDALDVWGLHEHA